MPEYAALDLETTGLDPARDRVIEIGAVAFTTDGVTATLERLVDPGRSVPEVVLRLTGIRAEDLRGATDPKTSLLELARFLDGRQPVGHGARLDVDFLVTAGLWDASAQILDTLDIARILLPGAASHSLPQLAVELGFNQPRPHRALDDADATRQLLLRLRTHAMGLDENLKTSLGDLVAPYRWPVAGFFAEALSAPALDPVAQTASRSTAPDHHDGQAAEVRGARQRTQPPAGAEGLAALLGPDGPLAAAIPDYEHRESQLQMLLAVAQIQQRGGTLVVEAGTGTGKSLAYLVPSIARATSRGERVVVSTHTHTLQEQLMAKDLPGLASWLPWHFEASLLKGRANYVSLRRWRAFVGEPCADADELKFKLKVMVWLHGTTTGDRAELRLLGQEEGLWGRIASDHLDCVGVRCTPEDCFVHRARAHAESSDIVVVNHSLLLADMQVSSDLLPEFDHLVVDEAHHLEEAATRGLRKEVAGASLTLEFERLARDQGERRSGLLAELAARPRLGMSSELVTGAEEQTLEAMRRTREFFESAERWFAARPVDPDRKEDSVRLTETVRADPAWESVRLTGENAATALVALDVVLRRASAPLRDWLGGIEPDAGVRELELIRGRLHEAAELLRQAILEPDPNDVYWLTSHPRQGDLYLRSAPVNIGPLLRDRVYADRRSTVLTSATLAVGGTFDFFRSRVGLGPEVEELQLASPFDYLHQALVCLPTDLPGPDDESFNLGVEEVVAAVGRRVGGRTLVLFTSHRQLREVHAALRQRVDLDELLILGQGIDGQRRQLLKAFAESDRPLLLGTASFWEGIDIPGERLSCVIMVRLPFPVPTDPVYAARAEQLRDPFAQLALPLAALRLKQGFGRLIRRSSDRGAVVVLDNRILGKDYGKAFLAVLPPASFFVGPAGEIADRVGSWLEAE